MSIDGARSSSYTPCKDLQQSLMDLTGQSIVGKELAVNTPPGFLAFGRYLHCCSINDVHIRERPVLYTCQTSILSSYIQCGRDSEGCLSGTITEIVLGGFRVWHRMLAVQFSFYEHATKYV